MRERKSRGKMQALHEEIDDVVGPVPAPDEAGNLRGENPILPPAPRSTSQDRDGDSGWVDPIPERRHRRPTRAQDTDLVPAPDNGRAHTLGFDLRPTHHRRVRIANQQHADRLPNRRSIHRASPSAIASRSQPPPMRSRTSQPFADLRKNVAWLVRSSSRVLPTIQMPPG